MNITCTTLTFLIILGFAAEPFAANVVCPPVISEVPVVSSQREPWLVVASRGDRPLKHVGVYLGDPAQQGSLIPDSTKTTSASESVTWHLKHSQDDQLWTGCSYTGTTAMLFNKLDKSISKCVATYDLFPSGKRLRLRSMSCE